MPRDLHVVAKAGSVVLTCRLQNSALECLAEEVELFQLTSSCQRSFQKTQDVGEQRTTAMVTVLGTSLVMPTRFLLAGQRSA